MRNSRFSIHKDCLRTPQSVLRPRQDLQKFWILAIPLCEAGYVLLCFRSMFFCVCVGWNNRSSLGTILDLLRWTHSVKRWRCSNLRQCILRWLTTVCRGCFPPSLSEPSHLSHTSYFYGMMEWSLPPPAPPHSPPPHPTPPPPHPTPTPIVIVIKVAQNLESLHQAKITTPCLLL